MGCLRVFLALSVVVTHSTLLFGLQLMPASWAVPIFFMISGFYMSLVLSGKYGGIKHLWTFYSNRMLRLYPTYLIALAVTAVLYLMARHLPPPAEHSQYIQALGDAFTGRKGDLGPASLVAASLPNLALIGSDLLFLFHRLSDGHWIYTYGATEPTPDAVRMSAYLIIPPAWSIGLEIWFYLLAPFLVRWRLWALAGLAIASFALHVGLNRQIPWASYYFFPANLGFFLVGVLGQKLWKVWRIEARLPGKAIFAIALSALALLMLREFIPFYRNYQGLSYLIAGCSIPFIFHSFKDKAWDRWIGNLSYPVYLFHVAVFMACRNYLHIEASWLVVPASLALSAIVVWALEEPLERLRARRVGADKPPFAPAVS